MVASYVLSSGLLHHTTLENDSRDSETSKMSDKAYNTIVLGVISYYPISITFKLNSGYNVIN
jgi:hypothetical protein